MAANKPAQKDGPREAGRGTRAMARPRTCRGPGIPAARMPASPGIWPARTPYLRSHGSGQVRQPAAKDETSAPSGGMRTVARPGACCRPEIPAVRMPASPGILPARPPAPSLTWQRTGARLPAARGETNAPGGETRAMAWPGA